jgi:hypothetical protein
VISYVLILEQFYPGTEWSMSDGDYDTLQWFSNSPKPTKEELDAKWQQALTARQAATIRKKRNQILETEVDPLVTNPLRWNSLSNQQQWISYRQALLDIPQQTGFPDNVTWPTKPAE